MKWCLPLRKVYSQGERTSWTRAEVHEQDGFGPGGHLQYLVTFFVCHNWEVCAIGIVMGRGKGCC